MVVKKRQRKGNIEREGEKILERGDCTERERERDTDRETERDREVIVEREA